MKIAVFIDGSNFYRKLVDLAIPHTSHFNFRDFILNLTGGVFPVYIGYYVGQVRREYGNQKSESLYANQQKLFSYLRSNIQSVNIVRGHIQNFNGIYKEKGVDVRLALDIYRLAKEDFYDRALLVSSDSDLIPAIRMSQELGKCVEYIGFSHKVSLSLVKECISKRLLSYKDVIPYGLV